ncbi:MAG TPA: hypothetical protein VIH05_05985 [Tepidiformaceae bacterium]|jgi:hypothetical protein
MPEGALFIGWGEPARDKEQKALQVFAEALEYYQKLQDEGKITSFEPVLLEPHGGELEGFFLLRGDEEGLAKLHASEEFNHLQNRVRLFVDHLAIVRGIVGDEMRRQMADYGQSIAALV